MCNYFANVQITHFLLISASFSFLYYNFCIFFFIKKVKKKKTSVLLHSVNSVAVATTLGDYDGGWRYGTFKTREAEKRKSTRHILLAEQLDRDLHDFGVELDTELPTMGNIVEDDDSGCEPKRKRVPQKSKISTSRLRNARRSKHVLKIRYIESVNAEHYKFEVGSGKTAPSFYQVHICTQPSCSCPDFNTYGMRSLSKHKLFVLANTNCLSCHLHWK